MRRALVYVVLVSAGWASGDASEPIAQEASLRALVASGTLSSLRWPNFPASRTYVASFYESAGYKLAWVRNGDATPQAQALVRILENAGAKGLDPEDYDGSRWAARLARLRPTLAQPTDADLVEFDLALTVSSLRYISDSSIGRVNPKAFCFGLDIDQKKCDLAGVLRGVVNAGDVRSSLEQLEPRFPAYRRAEQALEAYLALAREDDGELLPSTKKTVEPGDAYPGVARLARLLGRVGDLPPGAAPPAGSQIYEGALVEAVKHFQIRHGIDPDGRIGKATLQQLNTPLSRRVRQLQLALERWRWVPNNFTRPPVMVNIPEFRLRAFNDRYEAELEMKVVVGGAYRRQTPVFTNNMTHVIFRPYWNVPLSIQRAELVPKIAKDGSYLAKNDYEVVDSRDNVVASAEVTADLLAKLRSGKLEIRQVPGPKNALGFVKFMFPNEYNVYLHGTPAKSLFSRSRRDFSHGCIRVEKPEELAAWVFRDQPEWTMDRIVEAEGAAKTQQVNLAKPIPVLILYATAVVSESGEVFFYDDIYKHDASLEEFFGHGYPHSGWQPPAARCRRR
ncbi:MAG: L,D-transpeptidase family protein [Acidobacteriia bacterium]|nr:L,D-transpeptidase family protein [Terriglobia bacterium]